MVNSGAVSVEATAPPGMGILSVDTAPVKGDIFVGGSFVGRAPVSVALDPGMYEVRFGPVAGYRTPDPVSASIVDGEETSILATYVKAVFDVIPVAVFAGGAFVLVVALARR